MLWICYGLLCAAINVGGSSLECFELVQMFGYLVWTALGLSQQFITLCLNILQTYLSSKLYKLQPFSLSMNLFCEIKYHLLHP